MKIVNHDHCSFKMQLNAVNSIYRCRFNGQLSSPMLVNNYFYANALLNQLVGGYLQMGKINRQIVKEFMSCENDVSNDIF